MTMNYQRTVFSETVFEEGQLVKRSKGVSQCMTKIPLNFKIDPIMLEGAGIDALRELIGRNQQTGGPIVDESIWDDRIEMLMEAILRKSPQESIFSVSIIPNHPEVRQTVYLKRVVIEGSGKNQGFLKPLSAYDAQTEPDADPENLPATYKVYTVEQARSLRGIVAEILPHFEQDSEAKGVGLIVLSDLNKDVGRIERVYIHK